MLVNECDMQAMKEDCPLPKDDEWPLVQLHF